MAELNKTLSQLIVRIRRWLGETDASKSYWTDAVLKQLLNTEYRARCAELHMTFEGYFINVSERDITEDQSRYAWPPNFSRLHKMELVRTDGRRVPIVRWERHEEAVQSPQSGGDSYYPTYRPIGGGFELEPGPNESVTDGLRIEWYGIPVELEQDSDQLHDDFPDIFTELLVVDTAIAALNIEQIQDDGSHMQRTLEYTRQRWEQRWERYVDNRMSTSRNQIQPFIVGYRDS